MARLRTQSGTDHFLPSKRYSRSNGIELDSDLYCKGSDEPRTRLQSRSTGKYRKRSEDPDHGVEMGLYSYPILMTADIPYVQCP